MAELVMKWCTSLICLLIDAAPVPLSTLHQPDCFCFVEVGLRQYHACSLDTRLKSDAWNNLRLSPECLEQFHCAFARFKIFIGSVMRHPIVAPVHILFGQLCDIPVKCFVAVLDVVNHP